MYVCVCNAVTEHEVQRAIHAGARTLRELRDGLGVASECGRCARCARDCLRAASRSPLQPLRNAHPTPFLTLSEAV